MKSRKSHLTIFADESTPEAVSFDGNDEHKDVSFCEEPLKEVEERS